MIKMLIDSTLDTIHESFFSMYEEDYILLQVETILYNGERRMGLYKEKIKENLHY